MQKAYATALLLSYAPISHVSGFGTINEPAIIGQHCEHERITRAAFACPAARQISDGRCFEELSLHQLSGRSDIYVGQGSNGAVGAPDMLDPVPEGPEAHCDNADFLDTQLFNLNVEYPVTRQEATNQLQICVSHMRGRVEEGIDAAARIVDDGARIITPEVDISTLDCRFSFPALQMHVFARAKCSAIEGFGRALHGVQDFYAHSNWADDAEPPFGPNNPPGLKRIDSPAFLDLRGENDITEQVPHNLSTGCFGGLFTDGPVGKAGHPLEPGSIDCTGRITHHTLNKDNGVIDHVTGIVSTPGPNTPRSDLPGNFQRAVTAAITDSRRQWRHFREAIRRTYGTERGNIMICALVRDKPATDCYGRRVAILRDVVKTANRIAEMQIPVHRWLLEELANKPHDEGPGEGLTEQNSTKSRGSSDDLYRLHPGFEVDCDTQTSPDIGAAMAELVNHSTPLPKNKTAVVALTCARNSNLAEQIAHVWHAGDKGMRMHFGILPKKGQLPFGPRPREQTILTGKIREEDLIAAVLRTGGTYSILHNREAIPRFVDHVISRGLTEYDNSRDTATLLPVGLSISDYVQPESEPRRFSFDASYTDNVVIAVAPMTPKLALHVTLRHVRKNVVLNEQYVGRGGNSTFRAKLDIDDVPRTDAWFELEVAHAEGRGLVGSGLFEVSIESESTGANAESSGQHRSDKDEHDEL
ncbi:uncharacterized protein M421DRAFT_156107 [Didymella exigua CBS 183.55]|uniref:Uncharacterized protein n=1 Tax=Didymella exigua CBS 183.55 TaxID=1150837 RepID=A0A6A5RKM5_9PLEO|nr:uncharacterized protein M421DRAFT_156107 [Didymella exigua CBS 183.55]KAF1928189.1 hypothetical protein M421DRAFT_156107 [Didymella exigua CBS 183.55]